MKRLAILGASGHGKVVAEIAELLGWSVVFFDDAYPSVSKLEVWQVIGKTEDLLKNLDDFDGCFIAIGNNDIRLEKYELLDKHGVTLPCLIHPMAIVSRYAKISSGTVVMAGVVVNPFVKIDECCILNTACTLDHDCVVEPGVHVSPGVNLAGAVRIGQGSWIGIGANVKQCIEIGENVVVGAGAVVIENIPNNVVAVGVPARVKNKMSYKC
ncbi:MAG: acetyltransferase [Thiomicrospira sp.]|uniref:acetyltransferase n=1 Tax=Thiomicrospira sp. TaxID=935 RepID=UPI0019FF2A83|nr:acetyltransferase [Thiomicrospira sp.]MBE0494689.1 acetyltransferase [Thiomicrospira sp.]